MKRLYKSRKNKIIDGVCGGIGEYLGIDPTIVRIIFIVLSFFGGVGFILYLAGMLIIPPNPEHERESEATKTIEKPAKGSGVLAVIGILLVIAGVGLLLENLGFAFWHFLKIALNFLIPALLIAGGIFLIASYFARRNSQQSPQETESLKTETVEPVKKLYRSRSNKMLFGVCGGLGQYLNTDPTIIRILWVIFGITSFGMAILLYLAMAIIVPEEPSEVK